MNRTLLVLVLCAVAVLGAGLLVGLDPTVLSDFADQGAELGPDAVKRPH